MHPVPVYVRRRVGAGGHPRHPAHGAGVPVVGAAGTAARLENVTDHTCTYVAESQLFHTTSSSVAAGGQGVCARIQFFTKAETTSSSLTELAGVFEDLPDRSVEVGEDDGGLGVLRPEPAHGGAEQRVVVPDHVVDAAQAADAVVVRRAGARPEQGEERGRAPDRRVPRHNHMRRAVEDDEPLSRSRSRNVRDGR